MTAPSFEKIGTVQKLLALATHPSTRDAEALNAMRRIPIVLQGQGYEIKDLGITSSALMAALAASPIARNTAEIDRLRGVVKSRERAINALRTRRHRVIRRAASMREQIQALRAQVRGLEAQLVAAPAAVAPPPAQITKAQAKLAARTKMPSAAALVGDAAWGSWADFKAMVLARSANRPDWKAVFLKETGYTLSDVKTWSVRVPREAFELVETIDWAKVPPQEVPYATFKAEAQKLYGVQVAFKFPADTGNVYTRSDVLHWKHRKVVPIAAYEMLLAKLAAQKAA